MAAEIDLDGRREPAEPKSASGSSSLITNPVSDKFVSRATAASHSSEGASASTSTAAGLPVNGFSVNASTVLRRTAAIRRSYSLVTRMQRVE